MINLFQMKTTFYTVSFRIRQVCHRYRHANIKQRNVEDTATMLNFIVFSQFPNLSRKLDLITRQTIDYCESEPNPDIKLVRMNKYCHM